MKTYEEMLTEAYEKVKLVDKGSDRFDIPKVAGQVSGKNTLITNIMQIADYIRRPAPELAKFLQQQLATSGKIEGDRLVLNSKLSSVKVNEKVLLFAKEFVMCNACSKPDTEIISEKGIKFKHCLACGAKSPIRSHV